VGHQGPLLQHDKDYNGSRFNVLVEWENGEITTEPFSVIAADDPMTCAVYARELTDHKRLSKVKKGGQTTQQLEKVRTSLEFDKLASVS
jgi:hypothetical protein